jgi:heme O synthase-like polyprenyltransferase
LALRRGRFVPLGVAGTVYFAAALVSGALFLDHGIHGLRGKTGRRWARNEFLASRGYVTLLLAVLVVDHAYFV